MRYRLQPELHPKLEPQPIVYIVLYRRPLLLISIWPPKKLQSNPTDPCQQLHLHLNQYVPPQPCSMHPNFVSFFFTGGDSNSDSNTVSLSCQCRYSRSRVSTSLSFRLLPDGNGRDLVFGGVEGGGSRGNSGGGGIEYSVLP